MAPNCFRDRFSLLISSRDFFSSTIFSLPLSTWARRSAILRSRSSSLLKPVRSLVALSSLVLALSCSSRRLTWSSLAVREFFPAPCLLRISLSWSSSSWRRLEVGLSEFLLGVASSIFCLMAFCSSVAWLAPSHAPRGGGGDPQHERNKRTMGTKERTYVLGHDLSMLLLSLCRLLLEKSLIRLLGPGGGGGSGSGSRVVSHFELTSS